MITADDGSVEVGFFTQDEPKGKYAKYAANGEFEEPEGLYEGYDNMTKKLEIANYNYKITKSANINNYYDE